MATDYMETPDATQGTQFWSSVTGSVTYDSSTARKSGLASWKCDSGGGGSQAYLKKNDVVSVGANTGFRASLYVRFAAFPTATCTFLQGSLVRARITSGGILQLWSNVAQIGSDGSTLSTGTIYRICLAVSIDGSGDFDAEKVFLDGSQDISATASFSSAGQDDLFCGWQADVGTDKVLNLQHAYLDDDDSLTDTGDMRVTAKLPGAVNNDNYDDEDGTGAVNERPIDEANCKHHDAKSAVLQDYTLEIASAGDVDISGDTLVARCAWMWSVHSKDGDTYFIVDNGDSTSNSWSDQEAATLNSVITDSASYPSNAAGIGQKSGAAAPDDYLYECGVLIAYLVVTGATYNRSVSRTGSVSLSLARAGTFGRAPSRTGSVSMVLVRVGEFSRAPSRTGSVSESLAKSTAHPRAISRVGSVATSLARTLTNLRGVTRTGSVATSLTKAVTFVRSVTRTGSVSLSIVAVKLKERAVSRAGSVATSLARTLTNLRGLTRTGSVATVLTKAAIFPRAVSRVGSVAASVVATISLERAVSRTGSISTALEWTATIGRAISRVGSVATSIARSGTFSRVATRTGSVAASVVREIIGEEAEEFFTGMYRRIIG